MIYQKASSPKELNTKDLRWICDPESLEFSSTEELEPIEEIIGQERALKAIKVGINLKGPGFNIYISGLSGTGKATTVKKTLESISFTTPELKDYAYVNNFEDPDRPILLVFPAGEAKIFKSEISSMISFLQSRIPQLFEGERFLEKKKKILEEYSRREKILIGTFEEKLRKENFSLGQIQIGEVARPEIIPVIDNKPVPIYQLDELIKEEKINKEDAKNIVEKYNSFQEELVEIFKRGLKLSQELQQELSNLERTDAEALVRGAINAFKEKYVDEKIQNYLNQVELSILDNLQIFKGQKPSGETTSEGYFIDYFREYDMNIVLDNSNTKGCPIIIEISPTYTNLFGTIEKISDGKGGWYADFTKIKAGSILKANSGYLVLNLIHLFEEPGVWRTLKRILNYRKLEIQDMPSLYQLSSSILKPEPIDIDTKVILIGNNYYYYLLSELEDDFKKIFKIKADFDYEIKKDENIIHQYARVIKKTIKEENLLEFDNTAIAYLIELASRYSGEQTKLTTRFSVLADLAREADYYAKEESSKLVTSDYIKKAYYESKNRMGMIEEKISDAILENKIFIDTTGNKIGQINGLAYYGNDFYAFGQPLRITASVSLGNGSIVNVEREAGLSGKSYDKAMLIIAGYFRETFGQNFPLSFSANIVFEQSYGKIDGDSASAAEIFALLSTLSGLTLKQEIAVTGSVNQKGDIQPIGGVTEKIEGFFDICKKRNFTKIQGVIIPEQNIKDLMLKEEIILSVKNGEFHIYPIKQVEEGIEILTGIKAGKRGKDNFFEKNTVYGLVEQKLKRMYEKSKTPFKKEEEKKKTKSKSKTTKSK